MKCSEVRAFLSQVNDRQEPIAPIPSAELDHLSANGYILRTTKTDYDKEVDDVSRLSEITTRVTAESAEEERTKEELQKDTQKEHSFTFHFEGKEKKDELHERILGETVAVSREQSELSAMEANVNVLIQKKSMIDRAVEYDGGYLSLTGLGTLTLNDINVRNYRVADLELPDFLAEMKATYAELRSIADRAYVVLINPKVPKIEDAEPLKSSDDGQGHHVVEAPSLLWGTAIGLAKLRGDASQIGERFIEAFNLLGGLKSATQNRMMAAEIMTALGQDVQSLEPVLRNLDQQLRHQDVPKELSAGIAATIMAGRRFDGTYPLLEFTNFKLLTPSFEAASILAVMEIPYDKLSSKFQGFKSMFNSWGYTASEDTEIASAFLAIGELNADEMEEKTKYIVEQLANYLQYPLVAAAILASIPVFESHEVLDLMEKAVTLLSEYTVGLERSELVTLAVRMIHGVRNELVKEIDPTARITETPIQFTYPMHPAFFIWYHPVIVAHSSYHATFGGMGGFHPAHSHGVGGFAG